MGVVPRKFFCRDCKKDRWPGDCQHARMLDNWKGFGNIIGLTDLCRTCAKGKKECRCPEKARVAAKAEADTALALRVLALVGCSCAHHITAYLADDVKKTVDCERCCVTTRVNLPPEGSSVVDNIGRLSISSGKIKEAIAFGLTDNPDRELVYDKRMPGWTSNGHFIAHVGEEAYSSFLREYKSREAAGMFDEFKKWESAGLGAQLYFERAKCEPKDAPVDMVAWGVGYEWSVREPNDTLSTVAPAYSDILTSNDGRTSVYRAPGQESNGLSMLVAWDTEAKRIVAAVMPRRETIIT